MDTLPIFLRRVRAVWCVVLFLQSLAIARAEGPGDFTPWMSLSELNAHVEGLGGVKPENKNFWDRGNWMNAVEGRWEAGIPQYRISYGPVPKERRAYWWFWYINQDQQSFDQHVHQLADEGFSLVHFNSFKRPGGSERFQGVWQKLIPLTGAAPLPAGRYRLTEMERVKTGLPVVSLVIDGEKISGRSATKEFKGSVRDRYTVSVATTPLPDPKNEFFYRDAFAQNQEREFYTMLEKATWKEDDGKISVVQNGQTVLRFEREGGE